MRLDIDGSAFSLTNNPRQQSLPASAEPAPATPAPAPAPAVIPAPAEGAWITQNGAKHPLQPVHVIEQPQPWWHHQQCEPPPECEVCFGPHFPRVCLKVHPDDRPWFAVHPRDRQGPPPWQMRRRRWSCLRCCCCCCWRRTCQGGGPWRSRRCTANHGRSSGCTFGQTLGKCGPKQTSHSGGGSRRWRSTTAAAPSWGA